jgi:hypothetical protein
MATSPLDVDPPLSLEPIVGWRVWGLDRVAGALTLRSVTRPDHWPARDVMVATCLRHRGWTVPDEHCTCGLYAAASPERLVPSGVLGMEGSVVGTVSMWGRVIEHTFGARSRFAYPARLRLVCGPCLAIGAGAVTPVRVLGEDGSLKAVCQAHWSGPTARADPAAEVQAELLSTYGVELLPIEQLSGGLRTRPARITRLSVPAATPTMTSRVNAWRILIGMYFVARVIGTLIQPAPDASAAQTDVTSPPVALVSPSRSATGVTSAWFPRPVTGGGGSRSGYRGCPRPLRPAQPQPGALRDCPGASYDGIWLRRIATRGSREVPSTWPASVHVRTRQGMGEIGYPEGGTG